MKKWIFQKLCPHNEWKLLGWGRIEGYAGKANYKCNVCNKIKSTEFIGEPPKNSTLYYLDERDVIIRRFSPLGGDT